LPARAAAALTLRSPPPVDASDQADRFPDSKPSLKITFAGEVVVGVGEFVGVPVAVAVAVWVGVAVRVGVFVGVGVRVAVLVAISV